MKAPRVLLVDDNPVVREVTTAAFEAAGYEAVALESHRAFALTTVVDEEQPDVLLVDLHMPALAGSTLIKQVRASCKHACKILLYSATSSALELREAVNACGADGYVVKSADLQSIIDQVDRVLRRPVTQPPAELEFDGGCLELLRSLERRTGRKGMVEKLASKFAEDVPTRVSGIEEGLREGDAARVAAEAHSLKGAASQVGARGLSMLCERIERDARHGDPSMHLQSLAELVHLAEQAIAWLNNQTASPFEGLPAARAKN